MTTAWRCAPCQRMRRIKITQWSGSRACNLLAKTSLDTGGLAEESGIVFGGLLRRSAADCVAAMRAHASQAVSASCHCNQNFCPPPGSDTHLQIRRAPRSAATWVDVIDLAHHYTLNNEISGTYWIHPVHLCLCLSSLCLYVLSVSHPSVGSGLYALTLIDCTECLQLWEIFGNGFGIFHHLSE